MILLWNPNFIGSTLGSAVHKLGTPVLEYVKGTLNELQLETLLYDTDNIEIIIPCIAGRPIHNLEHVKETLSELQLESLPYDSENVERIFSMHSRSYLLNTPSMLKEH